MQLKSFKKELKWLKSVLNDRAKIMNVMNLCEHAPKGKYYDVASIRHRYCDVASQ